jgi:hypothetical protein
MRPSGGGRLGRADVGPSRMPDESRTMTKAKKSTEHIDRAAEYIDSPLMTQRLRYGRDLSARIEGNYGVYRTQARTGRRLGGHCSCPSDWWPCKHVRAVGATWERNPESFLDLNQVLKKMAAKPKADLLRLIGKMAMTAPECLTACGFRDFRPDENDSELG